MKKNTPCSYRMPRNIELECNVCGKITDQLPCKHCRGVIMVKDAADARKLSENGKDINTALITALFSITMEAEKGKRIADVTLAFKDLSEVQKSSLSKKLISLGFDFDCKIDNYYFDSISFSKYKVTW